VVKGGERAGTIWRTSRNPKERRSEMTVLYIILAVIFVVLLYMYVKVRSRRVS
jgi:hypothetical protein